MAVKKTAGDILALITAAGDILVSDGAGSVKKLAKGSAGQFLKVNSGGTDLEWGSVSVGIQPTKPYQVPLVQAAKNDTYYTVVDISGKGILSNMCAYGVDNLDVHKISLRVTIDGGTAYIINAGAAANVAASRFSSKFSSDVPNQGGAGLYQWIGSLFFNSSLKVECKQASGGQRDLHVIVDYALE